MPRLVIPNGTDVVTLQLEGTSDRAGLDPMRVEIRTVNGQAVWKGSAAGAVAPRSGILARVDVPAATLPADDYIVVLFEIGSGGSEREREQLLPPSTVRRTEPPALLMKTAWQPENRRHQNARDDRRPQRRAIQAPLDRGRSMRLSGS